MPVNGFTRDFKTFRFKFINLNPDLRPKYVEFNISGKDTCYWKGHYGAKIRNISFKLIPVKIYSENNFKY